jgi:hypothetical protein
VTGPRPLRLVVRRSGTAHDAADGHAAPDDLEIVGVALTGDHGGAQGEGFGIGHERLYQKRIFTCKRCSMSLTPEALYLQLGSLVATMPDLAHGPITPEKNRWLGRATALVELTGDTVSAATLKVNSQHLAGPLREINAQGIMAIVHQALAKAELNAPAASQGAFIAAGSTFDAFAAVGKALDEAKTDVLMVDPYADGKVLTDYAVLAPDTVSVRLLTGKETHKSTLKPAAERWAQQLGSARPLEVRLIASKPLHDRLILVDGKTAWTLGQSFNKLAERAHTSLVRLPQEAGAEKIAAYEAMWASATKLA